jgi:hypothetical protein
VVQTNGDGNVALNDDIIAKELLRLLENELVATRLVNRDNENRFGASHKIGDTINVKKPHRVNSAEGATLVIQPTADQTVPFTINRRRHVGLSFTAADRTLNINEFSDRFLKAPAMRLAHDLDYSVLECAKNYTPNWTGTPGVATGTSNGLTHNIMIDARADNTLLGVPMDGMSKFCLNPRDAASQQKTLTGVDNQALVKSAIETAYLGRMAGYDGFETAQMPTHTVGVATGTPRAHAAGGSLTGATISTDGWTNSTTGILKKGDIITFASVYSVNPATYQSTGMLAQFVVTADVDSGASTGPASVPISPAINDGTLTATDGEGNSISLAAYQNVTAAPADDALITVLGTGGTAYRQNLLLHRDAITLAVVDLDMPEDAPFTRRVRHDKSGLSLRMTGQYNINDDLSIRRVDILWGVHMMYPELARRVGGAA